MEKHGLERLAILLAASGILVLATCAAPPPTPTPTPPPPTSTATLPPTPTPTPEWGIAYAALYPLYVGKPSENRPLSLRLIHADGSGLTSLTEYIEQVTGLTASPDGRTLLFSASREDTDGDKSQSLFDLPHLYTVDVRTGEVLTLTSGTDAMEFSWALAWSPDSQQIAFVSSEVNTPIHIDVREFHWRLYVMNRDGTDKRRLTPQEGRIESVAWSPTGEQILFEQNGAIWTIHPDGSGLFKVADTPIEYYWRSYNAQPVWSPDGQRIAFTSPGVGEEKNADIFVVNADGFGLINLTEDSDEDFQPAWSPDGQHIAFVASGGDIYAINVNGRDVTTVFSSSTIGAAGPTWSPDGSQIAFIVNPGDRWAQQLYITDWIGDSPRQLGEDYVGERPVWVLIP